MSRIRYERTSSLYPHPMLERVGTMLSLANHYQIRSKRAGKNREEHKERADELEGDLTALVESIKLNGVLEPIKICRRPDDVPCLLTARDDWWIADGRNRWLAAKLAGLTRVPVMRIRTEDAPAIIEATVAGRRHYTKGATAYLACLLHPEIALDGEKRKKANQFGSGPALNAGPETSALSAEVLAAKFSVSLRLIEQAAELFRLLEGDGKPFREDAEAAIWSGSGLGGVKAGVDSLIKSGKEYVELSPEAKRAATAWIELKRGLATLGGTFAKWDSMSPEQAEQAIPLIRTLIDAAPNTVRSAMLDALAAPRKS